MYRLYDIRSLPLPTSPPPPPPAASIRSIDPDQPPLEGSLQAPPATLSPNQHFITPVSPPLPGPTCRLGPSGPLSLPIPLRPPHPHSQRLYLHTCPGFLGYIQAREKLVSHYAIGSGCKILGEKKVGEIFITGVPLS